MALLHWLRTRVRAFFFFFVVFFYVVLFCRPDGVLREVLEGCVFSCGDEDRAEVVCVALHVRE